MSQYTKDELQQFKRKRLLSIIKKNGFDQDINGEYQTKKGTLARNLKSDRYIQLILDGQLQRNDEDTKCDDQEEREGNEEEDSDEDEDEDVDEEGYQNDDERDEDAWGYPDYETYGEWKSQYIASGKERYGVGTCWDERDHGECLDPHCQYQHERYHVSSNHNNRRPRSNIRMTWGKHNGKLIHEIPRNYMLWIQREIGGANLDSNGIVVAREIRRVWSDIFD